MGRNAFAGSQFITELFFKLYNVPLAAFKLAVKGQIICDNSALITVLAHLMEYRIVEMCKSMEIEFSLLTYFLSIV